MLNCQNAGGLPDYPAKVVLQALLASNLTSFTEFAFGVVRPGITLKPNWHFEAVTHKLSQVASGKRLWRNKRRRRNGCTPIRKNSNAI